jgi:hypothetical protein
LTTVWGATTEVQRFAAPGVQTGATLTTDEGGGVTVIQQFDGAGWNRTSAQIVQDHGGGSVETQAFDANWNQLSATLVTTYGTTVETQAFDGAWNQTGATIVSHSDADTTQTQTFDGAWNQIGAEIVTVSGDQTTDRHFDGAWALTGGSVTTALSTTVDRVDSYDSGWTLLTSLTEATVRGAVGPQVFAGTAGVATTYVFDPGDIDGDAFASFTGAAASASGHDVIQFDGYGAAAHLVQLSASHWEVVSPTHQSEIFTVIGAFNPSAGDVVFH